jgi:hypothetical protein
MVSNKTIHATRKEIPGFVGLIRIYHSIVEDVFRTNA